jgi:hypothetical protein
MIINHKVFSFDSHKNELALEITRKAVNELAPEELDDIEDLIHVVDTHSEQDDALAFGVGELIAPLTPAIWSAVGAALTYCMAKLFDATVDLGKDVAKDWVKNRLDNKASSKITLHPELKAEVQAMVISQALQYGLDEQQAARLSVILVKRLDGTE